MSNGINNYREIANSIDNLVRQSEMNVSEFCKATDVDRGTYYRLVGGEAINSLTLMRIIDALGMEIKLVKKGGAE